ncbi:MAG: rRNA maturation RNase YbeY [bacterium]|nr:rRNA maturation RNase YbeY [bacterium]
MPIHLHKNVKASELTAKIVNQTFLAVKKNLRFSETFSVSVVLVGAKTMQEMNLKYRKVNAVTDVLSFPYNDEEGEVVICYQQAVKQAVEKQTPVIKELLWLLIHGILHLRGYDHETAIDAKVMRPLERKLLSQIYSND